MTNPPYDDQRAPRFLAYPYSLSGQGTPNTSGAEEHLRQLILQVLFTSPGERVNLPEFGAGVQRLVFAPSGDVLRASARYLITTSLQRWLGDRIEVEQVTVSSEPGLEETVTIEIAYRVRATRQAQRLLVQVDP
ncbi:MAG TPA: GPW/gp25 family protein [Chloroflexaceae bacterium]|nr:GPW/gp25 family protein [Chloroflexaceae bacterium]